jgi:hypothetical protein
MSRTLILFVLFAALGAGAYYAFQQKKQPGSRTSWDMEFAVPNTNQIGKIFIADRNGHRATLERREGEWLYNGQHKARPSAVQTLLETIQKVQVWYVPPTVAEPTMVQSLAAEGLKVEIYNLTGQKIKCYYVGGVTNDERGTFMMMENAEQPYVVHVPAFIGQLRVRYLLGDDDWRDRSVFSEQPEAIESVTIEYPQQKSESFRLEKTGDLAYTVRPFYSTTPAARTPQRKGVAEGYLLNFTQLAAEGFETNYPQRDSVQALVPFAIVTVKNTAGRVTEAKFWPQQMQMHQYEQRNYVIRYFTAVNGNFLLTQERVFGPIFRGYQHFFAPEVAK